MVLTTVASQPVFAQSVAWPDLSKVCAIKDRPATEMDVKLGCAAFVIKGKDDVAGEPLKLTIPQYALYVDEKTGKETPVVVIQAERKGGIQAIGYKNSTTGDFGVGLLREFRLLGTTLPK